MPDARQHHHDLTLIGRCNDFFITHTAAWLNNAGRAGINNHIQPITKREKGIARHGRTLQDQAGVRCLD